jgi:hypothetical protein
MPRAYRRIGFLVASLPVAAALGLWCHTEAARAAGCSDTWIGGSATFGTASDWSTGAVPGSSDDVCITATTATTPHASADTYSVSIDNDYTIHSLTIGGPNGTQTLVLGNNWNVQLSSASNIGAHGVLSIGNNSGTSPATLSGGGPQGTGVTLTNDGLITTDPCAACGKQLMVNVTNDASGVIEARSSMTVLGITNNGTTKLDNVNGVTQLFVGSGGSFVNGSGGTVVENIDTGGAYGLIAGGSVSLAGTLRVNTTGPASQKSWRIIQNAGLTGTFSTYLYTGAMYTPVYTASDLTLEPPSAAVVPESPLVPAIPVAGMGIGIAALAAFRQRRHP